MPNKIPNIIIGMPALNEEKNIGFILQDIAKQNTKGFKIKAVIVNSDASTDKTESVAASIKQLPVVVLKHKVRKGIAVRLNEIILYAKNESADALVLFDADIRITDRNCLKNLVAPILKNKADLTSCKITEQATTNIIDRSLKVSMNIKHSLFTELEDGDNIYTCYGPVRALSSKLFVQLQFPYGIANDAFTYLYAKQKNLQYKFVKNTEVIYKLPTALRDHQNQSQRFLESQKLLAKDFGTNAVRNAYRIPFTLKLKSVLKYFVQEPGLVFTYLIILASMQLKHVLSKGVPDLWEQAASSKVLNQT